MPTTFKIDPVTRIEGHLALEVTVDDVDGVQQVVDAKSSGTLFRGFEIILQGRDPLDAPRLTQRICGVCPISHGMASDMALEDALGVIPEANGRIMRNLVLGANFVQSHILHFYHLAALDYINTTGVIDMAPWSPRYVTGDMVGGPLAASLVTNYVTALEMRRKAHQMGAIIGGKIPASPVFVPGGATMTPTAQDIADFRTLLTELRNFIDTVMLPDVLTVAGAFPDYYNIGTGSGKLISYGVFDTDGAGTNLLSAGRYTGGSTLPVDSANITEYVKYSKYTEACGRLNPAAGFTETQADKTGAYSWLKSPRYDGEVYEAGPLARMKVSGQYSGGISVMDRIAARAHETKLVADAMDGWLNDITIGNSAYKYEATPDSASGIGMTEAPRGALAHWVDIAGGKISRYQVVTPTNWNASPRDDFDKLGPLEQSLVDTPVADIKQPIELLRVVHSYDPCLACAVHMVRPGRKKPETIAYTRPSL